MKKAYSFLALPLLILLVFTCSPEGGNKGDGNGNDNVDNTDTPVDPPVVEKEPAVVTLAAANVGCYAATLSASFADFEATPREIGFEWGTSENALRNTLQSEDVARSGSGSFSAVLEDISDETKYYYRAYVVIWSGGKGNYHYGNILSFTTLKDENKPDPGTGESEGNQPGWYEVPLMNIAKSGDYKTDKYNSDYFYAIHMCTGGEKGPNGTTARNFTVCFSAEQHCALWIAAPRHSMYVGNSGRSEAYGPDDLIPSGIQYLENKIGADCNRGHLLGSSERTSSRSTNTHVFKYSNIAPQLSSGFNQSNGGWNLLEDYVDKQVCNDTLYIVIGCYYKEFKDAYDNTVSPKKISYGGRTDVGFPTMFYYVLLRTKAGNSTKALKDCTADEIKCAAFVRAHSNALKGKAVSSKDMMSVSDLEILTGFTYFPNVPNAPKDVLNASEWGL